MRKVVNHGRTASLCGGGRRGGLTNTGQGEGVGGRCFGVTMQRGAVVAVVSDTVINANLRVFGVDQVVSCVHRLLFTQLQIQGYIIKSKMYSLVHVYSNVHICMHGHRYGRPRPIHLTPYPVFEDSRAEGQKDRKPRNQEDRKTE